MRHSYGTLLSKGGVSPREAMSLMRHTDLRLTMRVYTDPRIFDLARAIEKLPISLTTSNEAEAQCATGTDGNVASAANTGSNGSNGKDSRGCGRSESVSSESAETRSCAAGIGGQDGDARGAVSSSNGGNWRQKNPSGEEGSKERAMGFEPTTSALGRLHSATELRPQDGLLSDKHLRV